MDGFKYNRNTLFNDDLLYHYMLESDLPELKALCLIDKNASKLCHSFAFWTKKMMYDNLPIYQQHNNRLEYERVSNAVNKANQFKEVELEIQFKKKDVRLLFDKIILNDLQAQEIANYDASLYEKQDVCITKSWFFTRIAIDTPNQFFLLSGFNKKELDQMIINLFYYYPTITYQSRNIDLMI